MKGIKHIQNGFLNFKEINRVTYDPKMIDIEAMERALKRSGTLIGIAKEDSAKK